MTKRWEDNFDALLAWLDPDREQAGAKYEDIRHSLIHIFSWQGCFDAEDLADETISRVAKKFPELASSYTGDPALYFYGVAKRMRLEIMRRARPDESAVLENIEHPDPPSEPDDSENVYDCLHECLSNLIPGDRELVLLYHQEEQPNIESRRTLAQRIGVSPNNLRVKVHRIRGGLHKCIEECVRQKTANETD
jgi:RNA polymerase sigma factor (sigma-70 family)